MVTVDRPNFRLSDAERAEALDALAEHGDGCAAIFLACFGDPGLQALKETSPVPVVGMAEGSCHLACTLGRSFSIVTGGDRWGPMLRELIASLGLSSRLASVRTVAPTRGEIARDPEAAVRLLADQASRCAAEDGADAGAGADAERRTPAVAGANGASALGVRARR